MSKLRREQKIEIYYKRKSDDTVQKLALEYKIRDDIIKYLIRLIDRHGSDILSKERNNYNSPLQKEKIINKVLVDHPSVKSTTKEKVVVVFELQRTYPIRILLAISGIKRSTYYYHLSNVNKDVKNDELMHQIIDIFYTHKGRYGYRRITLELTNRGYEVNHKKVKRLMTVMGLYGITPKAKYKSYKGDINATVKN